MDQIQQEIDKLVDMGIMTPSDSPSLIAVAKKEGGGCICIDFRALNLVTASDPFEMPMIDEILDSLATAKLSI